MNNLYIKKITIPLWNPSRAWGLFWIRPDGKHQWIGTEAYYQTIRYSFKQSLDGTGLYPNARNEIGGTDWVRSNIKFGWD